MADMDSIGVIVELHVYDLTKGLAASLSQMLLGKHLEGVWHTAVVAYGREYFFGAGGIQSVRPCSTVLGEPDRVVNLGDTFIPYQVFLDYVLGLGESTFRADNYDLFRHNCNTFSNEVSQFLCGADIPKYIIDLPQEILSTPIGAAIQPLLDSLGGVSRSRGSVVPTSDLGILSFLTPPALQALSREQIPESSQEIHLNTEQLCRTSRVSFIEPNNEEQSHQKEKKKKRTKNKRKSSRSSMADSETTSQNGSDEVIAPVVSEKPGRNAEKSVAEFEEQERQEAEEKKKQREPPIIYKDLVDLQSEFDGLVDLIAGILTPEEQQSMEELHQYMLEDEGSWALGDSFLSFVGRILHDKSQKSEARVKLLNVLAVAALKDDVILMLHQDRREHILMNFAQDIDRIPLEEQLALTLFFANLFENLSSSEWLLYISEWQYCNNTLSNIRVTTKVAVNSLLSDNTTLQDRGSAILHNLACKEVFDDVAVELTMAVLQYFNSKPPEENLYRCMKALHRFCLISAQDVPQLVQMIGPEPNTFKGTSERVDNLISEINKKLR
ncbi:uncharacterized protein LOC132196525 isoform X2 [Neocloeon triangulifer]|uniref:uncharacterized protein LOC132196525 isoform X2 n=1 Tax=Neocloeon triangulifer TaxID=2078957 RepID=UPI00286F5BB5|nr:uncharacterized protein LOC132196525 isoform X2 [Neocloeon triangulifer]